MKIAYFWLTEQGHRLAQQIQAACGGTVEPKTDFAETVRRDFAVYDALVFVMAAGIVVRTIAPCVRSKASDPAVVVLDQRGNYAISLLSGHLGGANALTRQIARAVGAVPVITTGTDVEGVPAFDEIAKANGLVIENLPVLKWISGALLEGQQVFLTSSLPVAGKIPSGVVLCREPELPCGVAVSYGRLPDFGEKKVLVLRPKCLVIGIGCKRDVDPAHLEHCFLQFLQQYGLSLLSVERLATIGLKQQEPAILQLSQKYGLPLEIVPDDAIRSCDYPFAASEFVQQVTGLPAVAEACSYLASGRGEPLTGKVKYPGVTLAASCRSLPPLQLEGNEP